MLIDNYNSLLTSVVRVHLRSLANYEDECVSDTLLAIWDNINGFNSEKNSFKNWICAIAKYKAIDYKRKYLSHSQNIYLDNNSIYIDKNLLKLELKEEVDTTLSYLNNEEKELFIRYYLEGETLKEISLSEKINISSLYSKLSRGRKKIRESISKSGGN